LCPEALVGAQRTERRRHQRAELTLIGRYMLRDRREYACRTIDVSASGIAMLGAIKGSIGERVVAHLDRLGRVEGSVARQFGACFAIELCAPALKRERIDQRLTWLIQRPTDDPGDMRRHVRARDESGLASLRTSDGRESLVALIDFSPDGAAVCSDLAPPVGSKVIVNGTIAHVLRHFPGGFAVEFVKKPPPADVWAG
jgi:hypothetical protein